jgi:hypothetical protein
LEETSFRAASRQGFRVIRRAKACILFLLSSVIGMYDVCVLDSSSAFGTLLDRARLRTTLARSLIHPVEHQMRSPISTVVWILLPRYGTGRSAMKKAPPRQIRNEHVDSDHDA